MKYFFVFFNLFLQGIFYVKKSADRGASGSVWKQPRPVVLIFYITLDGG